MIEYKGFEVSPEDCFWPASFGYKYKFTNDGFVTSEKTIQDVKDNIDERLQDYSFEPLTQTGFDLFHDQDFWQKRYEQQLEYIQKNPQLRSEVFESAFKVLGMCQAKIHHFVYKKFESKFYE